MNGVPWQPELMVETELIAVVQDGVSHQLIR
jgi:hypothetical protein